MVIRPGEELCLTEAFELEKLLDFGIILVRPVSVLSRGEAAYLLSSFLKNGLSCCHWCSGLAVPPFLVWPGASLQTQFSSPAHVAVEGLFGSGVCHECGSVDTDDGGELIALEGKAEGHEAIRVSHVEAGQLAGQRVLHDDPPCFCQTSTWCVLG